MDKSLETGKLPKVFKRKWVEALRSGEYKQGRSSLKQKSGDESYKYCCLGVAAEIAGCKFKMGYDGGGAFIQGKITQSGLINPKPVTGYTKIPKLLHGSEGVASKLANFNDQSKWSFKKIATWVEKNL